MIKHYLAEDGCEVIHFEKDFRNYIAVDENRANIRFTIYNSKIEIQIGLDGYVRTVANRVELVINK